MTHEGTKTNIATIPIHVDIQVLYKVTTFVDLIFVYYHNVFLSFRTHEAVEVAPFIMRVGVAGLGLRFVGPHIGR